MFIFRVEHKREYCTGDSRYEVSGKSLTGHGTYKKCDNLSWGSSNVPNFGLYGSPPYTAMMLHERCAVMADQWQNWIGPYYECKDSVECEDYCHCPVQYTLNLLPEWQIMCYWVNDDMEGIDWRIDNNQIVFNPSFAINMGSVEEWEVDALTRENVNA